MKRENNLMSLSEYGQKNPKQFYKKLLFFFVGTIVLIAVYKSCTAKSEDEIKAEKIEAEKKRLNKLKIEALSYSQVCVEQNLKSPSTAEFPYATDGVVQINDSVFVVNSYVDSQNGFGAMIRTKYRCKLTILKDEKFTCDDVILME
ncbi:MAG: hypothetical protein O9282_03785 [Flavobacterium sp.]|jgi:hypothetical protein|uniref:hypothetical protein n=1 Tax=Flavobacterium sp. TaxID=239 RepID=UPI0022C9746E|nr:hypothetical protein [Flavobacterium sp.]MCZ8330414.1 hypothetical protein [Flavobacterium sp.]